MEGLEKGGEFSITYKRDASFWLRSASVRFPTLLAIRPGLPQTPGL